MPLGRRCGLRRFNPKPEGFRTACQRTDLARVWPKLHPSPTYLLRCALTTLVTLTSASAFAVEYAQAYLEVLAPNEPDCSSMNALMLATEQRLQRRLFVSPQKADLKVNVRFGHAEGEWTAEIDLLTANGTHLGHRRIVSPTRECKGLDDSLALVVALMVDLTKADVSAHATPEAEIPTHGTTEVRVPPPESTNAWSAVLSLGPLAAWGQLPKLSPGVGLTTELRARSIWALTLGVQAFPTVTVTDGATARASFTHYSAQVGACWFGVHRSASDLLLCGGAQLGIVRAVGAGYATNHSALSPLVSPFLEAESQWWPWSKVGFLVGLGASTPLVRDQFYATRADGSSAPLFKPSILVPYLHAGLCLAL